MPMDAKTSQAMVRRRFAELDKKNFGVFDEMFAGSYRLNLPGMPKALDLDGTKDFYYMLYTAFPDLKHKIVEQISAGNKVVTRWEATGTHRAAFMGIAPTQSKVTFTGINIYTLTRGKLSQSHVNWDMLSLMQQIGTDAPRLALPPKRAAEWGSTNAPRQKKRAPVRARSRKGNRSRWPSGRRVCNDNLVEPRFDACASKPVKLLRATSVWHEHDEPVYPL